MNRADLAWALSSVIPHAGRTPETAFVGIDSREGHTYAFATDKYTAGIARIDDGTDIRLYLSPSEATELMRFVRPTRVPERVQEVSYAQRPGELHVGFDDDSAVFETLAAGVTLNWMFDYIDRLQDSLAEWDELIYQPKLMEKFAKAQREETDRLRILPRHANEVWGAAIVTVGADFVGAIAGLTYDQLGSATVADFLNREEAA